MMITKFHYRIVLFLFFIMTSFLSVQAQPQRPLNKPVIVIVHGAWGGGWAWRDVAQLFKLQGFEVFRPTLTGLGEKVHLASPETDLETHITDIVNLLRYEDLRDVILVGHSYGGMVITGVADREGARLKQIIYLDALLPDPGQNVVGKGGLDSSWILPMTHEGFVNPVWVPADATPPKDEPQPLATFTQPIKLEHGSDSGVPSSYLLTVDPGKSPEQDDFYHFYQKAVARQWPHETLTAGHNPQWENPEALVAKLKTLFVD